VSLRVIQEALLLATVRRCLRAPDAAPLAPVRSLHYFIPVIEEIMATPLQDVTRIISSGKSEKSRPSMTESSL